MNRYFSFAIIGSKSGPISIHISIQTIISIILCILLISLFVLLFMINIKTHNKGRAIFYGVISFILIIVYTFYITLFIKEFYDYL